MMKSIDREARRETPEPSLFMRVFWEIFDLLITHSKLEGRMEAMPDMVDQALDIAEKIVKRQRVVNIEAEAGKVDCHDN